MINKTIIDSEFTSGGHPWRSDIKELARCGFRSVINLRTSEETQFSMHDNPDREGADVRDYGMSYEHIPITPGKIGETELKVFRKAVEKLPKPIYAHSKAGRRSAALYLICKAEDQNWTPETVIRLAKEMGVALSREYIELVHTRLDLKN